MSDYETVILVKPEAYVYQIPPRTTNRGYRYIIKMNVFACIWSLIVCMFIEPLLIFYRAADWNLNQWLWSGRLRLMAKGKTVTIRLEDKNSGSVFVFFLSSSSSKLSVKNHQ